MIVDFDDVFDKGVFSGIGFSGTCLKGTIFFSGAVFSGAGLVSVGVISAVLVSIDLPVLSPNFLLIGLLISVFCSIGSIVNFGVSLVFDISGSDLVAVAF
jgi:hypothetical protein